MIAFGHFRTLLGTVCILLVGAVAAQPTLTSAYFPAPGDTLFTAFDDLPVGIAITPPGGDQTWDFSDLERDFTRLRVVRAAAEGMQFLAFPNTEILFPQGENAEGYYNVEDTRYELVGYAGEDPLGQGLEVVTRFDPPYVERWAPLAFFDIRSTNSALLFAFAADDFPGGIFDNLPIAPDSIRVRVAIQRTDVVDGWGEVTLPGNLVYEVLREKRTEYRDIRLDAKISPLPWFDITDLVLQNIPIPGVGRDTTIDYYHWSADTKEAVAVINTEPNGDVILAQYKADPLLSADQTPTLGAVGMWLFPNPAYAQTQVTFEGLTPGAYQLQLVDVAGRVARAQPVVLLGKQTESFSLQGLPTGVYVCRLVTAGGQLVAQQRLVVE